MHAHAVRAAALDEHDLIRDWRLLYIMPRGGAALHGARHRRMCAAGAAGTVMLEEFRTFRRQDYMAWLAMPRADNLPWLETELSNSLTH